jgi:hypothetical protein
MTVKKQSTPTDMVFQTELGYYITAVIGCQYRVGLRRGMKLFWCFLSANLQRKIGGDNPDKGEVCESVGAIRIAALCGFPHQ